MPKNNVVDLRTFLNDLSTRRATPADWVDTFSQSLEAELFLAVEQAERAFQEAAGDFPHSPLLVEPLLGDIAALLDRCHAYRMQAADLATAAVTHASQYDLSQRLSANEHSLVDATFSPDRYRDLAEAVDRASQALGGTNEELASAWQTRFAGDAAFFRALAQADQTRRDSNIEKLHATEENANALHQMRIAPGTAQNYAERYDRLLELCKEDIFEAYLKAQCALIGLKSIYSFDERVPLSRTAPLNELISWTRRAMRHVEHVTEMQVLCDVTIQLVAPFFTARAGSQPLVARAAFDTAMAPAGDGRVQFTLDEEMFRNLNTPRVRAVGLSTIVANRTQDATVRVAAVVFPPEQELIGFENFGYRRPAITIYGAVLNEIGVAPVTVSGECVHNLDPRGTWTVQVMPQALSGSPTLTKPRDNSWLRDLTLHLAIVCRPPTRPDRWEME